jgi:predicted RNA binding protein YcfA (HicA-like mRNA interferase family)
MTRLPAMTGKAVISALSRAGWAIKDHRGSHVKLVKSGVRHPIIVPAHGAVAIPKGTLRNIIRAAGLTAEEFVKLL